MSRPAHLLFRTAVLAILAAGLFFHAYMVVNTSLPTEPSRRLTSQLLYSMLGAIYGGAALLGLVLAWRSVRWPYARALSLFLALVGYLSAVDAVDIFRRTRDLPVVLDHALDACFPLAVVCALAALVRFTALFPRPLQAADFAGRRVLPGLRARFLRPGVAWGVPLGIFAAAQALVTAKTYWLRGGMLEASLMAVLVPLLIGLVLGGMVLGASNLRVGAATATSDQRRRLFWVCEGALAATSICLLASALKVAQMLTGFTVPLSFWYPVALYFSLLVLLLCLAVAVFYAGVLDPGLVIRRTAVLGALGVLMVFVFAGTESLVQQYLVERLDLSDRMGGMLTGGIVAFTFDPIKRRLAALASRVAARMEDLPPPIAAAADPVASLAGPAPAAASPALDLR